SQAGGAQATIATGNDKVLMAKSLSVDSSSKLDIKDNGIAVDYTSSSPLSSIKSAIVSAYNTGSWDGNGITSSLAAASVGGSHQTAVGYGENSIVGRSTFFGESVDNTSVLLKYTYAGDANLDGAVDTIDFNIMAANFGGTNKIWTQG